MSAGLGALTSEERVDLLHEVIEMLPHDRRYLEEIRKCCLAALPDATDNEISRATARSLVVLGRQLGFTHMPSDKGCFRLRREPSDILVANNKPTERSEL
jgi:hypothetical protein